MSTRKTEMRVRVSLSLKGQGGRSSCRHGKMMQLLAKLFQKRENLGEIFKEGVGAGWLLGNFS